MLINQYGLDEYANFAKIGHAPSGAWPPRKYDIFSTMTHPRPAHRSDRIPPGALPPAAGFRSFRRPAHPRRARRRDRRDADPPRRGADGHDALIQKDQVQLLSYLNFLKVQYPALAYARTVWRNGDKTASQSLGAPVTGGRVLERRVVVSDPASADRSRRGAFRRGSGRPAGDGPRIPAPDGQDPGARRRHSPR